MIRSKDNDDVPVNKVKKHLSSNWSSPPPGPARWSGYLWTRPSMKPTRIYPAGFAYYTAGVLQDPSARSQTAGWRS